MVSESFMTKRSVCSRGYKTSVSLEREFWLALKEIAIRKNMSIGHLVLEVICFEHRHDEQGLCSAVRVFILNDAIDRAQADRARARKEAEAANELRSTIRALMSAGDQAPDGFAPITAVIAGGRANA